ncbi:hypothetical protein ACWEVT_42620, partial [Saccharopolyspora sp. NPDC003762]
MRANNGEDLDIRSARLTGLPPGTSLPQVPGMRRRASRTDNLRFDDAGRLWAAAMDGGVHCYDPDGTLLGRILVPDVVANIRSAGLPRSSAISIEIEGSISME